MTVYGSSIEDAIQLADAGDGSGDGELRNASGSTRVGGVEAAAIWRFGTGGKFLLTYGYTAGSRTDATTGAREDAPLLPRNRDRRRPDVRAARQVSLRASKASGTTRSRWMTTRTGAGRSRISM